MKETPEMTRKELAATVEKLREFLLKLRKDTPHQWVKLEITHQLEEVENNNVTSTTDERLLLEDPVRHK